MNSRAETALQKVETGMATVTDASVLRAYITKLESTRRVMSVDEMQRELENHSVVEVSEATGVPAWTLYDIKSGRVKRGFVDWAVKLTDYFLEQADLETT